MNILDLLLENLCALCVLAVRMTFFQGSLCKGSHLVEKRQGRYLSYLLRLWQTSSKEEQVWRASLEEPGTRERRGFASPEALFDFLAAQTGRHLYFSPLLERVHLCLLL